jgi:hypothetical protein
MSDTPPRWLSWTNTGTMRGITTVISIIAILAAVVLGVRQQLYISCVGEQGRAAAVRTAAIAAATDRERVAQRLLIQNADPTDAAALRAAVLDAYDVTDRVRAENPPPPPGGC